MFLRKLGKRGVAMTEYAILLAFVAAVAVAFISDGGLGKSIEGAVAKVVAVLDGSGNSSGKNLLGEFKLSHGSMSNLTGKNINTGLYNRLHTDVFNIDPNSEYEIKIDTSKLTMRDGEALEVGFFVTDADGKTNYNDSGWISTIKDSKANSSNKQYNCEVDGNIATISFKTGESSSLFGMNFRTTVGDNFISSDSEIKYELNNAVSLYEK